MKSNKITYKVKKRIRIKIVQEEVDLCLQEGTKCKKITIKITIQLFMDNSSIITHWKIR